MMKDENGILLITIGSGTPGTTPLAATEIVECCMCGDRGLPDELVPCCSCNFRFQHRYCSNQYPDAASYETCNWCLLMQKKDNSPKEKHGKTSSQELLNSCSSSRKRKSGKSLDRHLKKGNSPGTPLPRQMVVKDGHSVEEKPAMRRTSLGAVVPNAGITKYGLRNRAVRRYKLLDEVATE